MKRRKKAGMFCLSIMLAFCLLCGCSADGLLHGKADFVFNEHLEDVVLTINGNEYLLQDIAYYVANGEAGVEAQALVYNPEHPEQYWNKHTNGIFIKVQAKQNTMDNYIRDELLALAAVEQGLALSDQEKSNCEATVEQLYSQLSSYQKKQAGITEESLKKTIEKAYLGQRYVQYRLDNDGSDKYTAEDWQLNGVCYKGLLSEYDVQIIDAVWDEVDFGAITIEREND